MEATAQHDFNAKEEDELSFRQGDILKILNKDEDPHWYKAEMGGAEGFVPSNYIKMSETPWYLGKFSRNDANSLLNKPSIEEGSFLVRQCESTPGDFSISVKAKNDVQHFKVLRNNAGEYYLWAVRFKSLNELIDHHRTASLNRNETVVLKDLAFETRFVQALFDFSADENGELEFKRGDVITVVNKNDIHWWEGMFNNRRGMFPSNYVCPYNPSLPNQ